MSQLTAAAPSRTAVRLPRPKGAPALRQPRLRVVTGDEARRSNTGFVILCTSLLTLGLLVVLLLNTARAEQSYAMANLQQTHGQLANNEEALRTDLSNVQAPQQLALKAQESGMVPAKEVVYVRLSDGKVLGVAPQTPNGSAFTVSTLPNTPASNLATKAVAAADSGIVIVKPPPPVKVVPKTTDPKAGDSKSAPSTKTDKTDKADQAKKSTSDTSKPSTKKPAATTSTDKTQADKTKPGATPTKAGTQPSARPTSTR